MRIGLAIDQTTNDLFFRNDGSLAVVVEAEAVGQHVRQRLKTFQGEWFLDNRVGVPWLDQIFARQYDPVLAEAVMKNSIMGTDGVVSIDTFSVSFSREMRRLNIREVTVKTDYDKKVTLYG